MKVVVVNKHIVAANRKKARHDPPLRVSKGRHGKPTYVSSIDFNGPARLVYDPENPLPCGATVWLEIMEEDMNDRVAQGKIE